MFANREIRYRPQRSPLTACTSYPAFPRGPLLPPPRPPTEAPAALRSSCHAASPHPWGSRAEAGRRVPQPASPPHPPGTSPPPRALRPQPCGEDGSGGGNDDGGDTHRGAPRGRRRRRCLGC